MDLEAGNLFLDVRLVGQERRDHDQRPQVGRHAVGHLEPRKDPWAEEGGQDPVDERERQVGGGREAEDREDKQCRSGRAAAIRQHERHREDRGRNERQRADIGEDAGGGIGPPQSAGQRYPDVQRAFQIRPTAGDQVVAGVDDGPLADGRRGIGVGRALRHRNGGMGDLELRPP